MYALALLAFLGTAVDDSARVDRAANLKDRLQGDWKIISIEMPGKEVTPAMLAKIKVAIRFKESKMIRLHDGMEKDEATYKIDAKKSPMHFDTTNKKGVTEQGLFALHGDILIICATTGTAEARPTDFKIVGTKKHILTVWKRIKPKPDGN